MVQRQNKETGLFEIHIPASITEIREEVLTLNNHKETPYHLGTAKIKYPDGGEEDILTRFYSRSIMAHPDIFKVGKRISLAIQAEGDYAGRAVAQLPGASVDIERLLGKKPTEAIPLTPLAEESIVGEHVVDEEVVA
ncbi:hypothetical protein [Aestuariivivens insulae]|uniref:hypothetical protein n=1 Tax=Aestuariivivens insulae TaxID=1621988 RepID=UPI001F5AAF3C|nr:hypothetical protein [Aestuariivivens insulae]